ncbi:MAG: F0F1 ATP synthase subunit B [Alphaproteobacteria bacterium]|nr:F0F1 ATP synthase subunit B [Alphaproteobacteria bacterium]
MQELLHDPTIWFAVSFAIFLVIVWKAGGKAIAGALDNYGEKVKNELEQAAALHAEAAQLLAETQAKHNNAFKESDAIIARAEEQARLLQAQAEKDLETTLKRREQQALDRIQVLQEQAATEIRAQAVDVALKAAEALLRTNLGAEHDNKLIEQQTADMAKALKNVA